MCGVCTMVALAMIATSSFSPRSAMAMVPGFQSGAHGGALPLLSWLLWSAGTCASDFLDLNLTLNTELFHLSHLSSDATPSLARCRGCLLCICVLEFSVTLQQRSAHGACLYGCPAGCGEFCCSIKKFKVSSWQMFNCREGHRAEVARTGAIATTRHGDTVPEAGGETM